MLLSQYPDTSLWCVEETWCRKENRSCSCRRKISGLKSVLLHRQESGDKVINYINHVRNAIKNSVHHIANSVCNSLKSSCSNIMSREPTTVTSPTSLLYHNIITQVYPWQFFHSFHPSFFRTIPSILTSSEWQIESLILYRTPSNSSQSQIKPKHPKKNPLRLWVTAKAIQKKAKHSRLSRKWPDNHDSCV